MHTYAQGRKVFTVEGNIKHVLFVILCTTQFLRPNGPEKSDILIVARLRSSKRRFRARKGNLCHGTSLDRCCMLLEVTH